MKKSRFREILKEEIKNILNERGMSEDKATEFVKKVIDKKVNGDTAFQILTDWNKFNHSEIETYLENLGYEDLRYGHEPLRFGSGQLEESLQELGYKLTPSIFNKIPIDEISSLIYNVFYGSESGLKQLVPTSIIKEFAKRIVSDKKLAKQEIEDFDTMT